VEFPLADREPALNGHPPNPPFRPASPAATPGIARRGDGQLGRVDQMIDRFDRHHGVVATAAQEKDDAEYFARLAELGKMRERFQAAKTQDLARRAGGERIDFPNLFGNRGRFPGGWGSQGLESVIQVLDDAT
jgi:hypothetical protein